MELVDNEVDAPPNTLDEIICLNAVKDSVAGKPLLQKYDLVSKSPVSGHWRARSTISHYLDAEKAIFRLHNFLGGIGNGITTCSKSTEDTLMAAPPPDANCVVTRTTLPRKMVSRSCQLLLWRYRTEKRSGSFSLWRIV